MPACRPPKMGFRCVSSSSYSKAKSSAVSTCRQHAAGGAPRPATHVAQPSLFAAMQLPHCRPSFKSPAKASHFEPVVEAGGLLHLHPDGAAIGRHCIAARQIHSRRRREMGSFSPAAIRGISSKPQTHTVPQQHAAQAAPNAHLSPSVHAMPYRSASSLPSSPKWRSSGPVAEPRPSVVTCGVEGWGVMAHAVLLLQP